MLGPKFSSYPILNSETMQFEGIFCHTYSRWERRSNGSPEEQLLDGEEYGAHVLTEEQIIDENKPRSVKDKDKKEIYLRKMMVTNLRDFPRL